MNKQLASVIAFWSRVGVAVSALLTILADLITSASMASMNITAVPGAIHPYLHFPHGCLRNFPGCVQQARD